MPSSADAPEHQAASATHNPQDPSSCDMSSELRTIDNLVNAAPDPQRARHYVVELSERHSEFVRDLANDRRHLLWLVTIFSFSRFLAEDLLKRPEGILSISDVDRVLSKLEYDDRLNEFLVARGAQAASALDLALFRRREMLRVVLRDGLGLAKLSELTEELSNLADAILGCALQSVTVELNARYGVPDATFTVLALGKLGGRELNYSSDIDLLYLYSANGDTPGPESITNKEFFKKVSNRFTEVLSTYTSAGLCYRVDLRLRPEGAYGDVCISMAGAAHYYARRARDWELQMLIKARVAAGDGALGKALLDSVEPLIYSTTLDFSAIETMSATRDRMTGKLNSKRLRNNDLDVKLARGGIRDIEFLVQCLQRLHGGREAWLRHGGTLLALSRLLDKDLLSATEYSRLANAYQFLRHLEHRLQFEDDRQTHTLPGNADELDRLAERMPAMPQGCGAGVRASVYLLQELNQHFESVRSIYDRIVYAQRPLYYTHSQQAGGQPADAVIPDEQDTGVPGGLSENLMRSVERAAPLLAQTFRERRVRRNQRMVESFVARLLDDAAFLGLMNSHSLLAHYTLQILEVSPYLSEQLIRNPQLLEEVRLVADHPNRRWAFEGLASPLNDVGALRRFFRRQMVRIQAASICLNEPVFQTLDRTSALAEFVIARAYRIALEQAMDRAQRHLAAGQHMDGPLNEMIVVALGRLGMREFDVGSDADLTFIIPDSEVKRLDFWTRVAEHLIEILSSYTGDGTILSIDTRLRPNGREGLLVQTESAYTEYFALKAEAWEGIAYMKARAVAGDLERATKFLSELQQVDWRRYGQSGRSKQDLRMMRSRLQREQGGLNPLKAGSGGYYDADFILMYLRLKGAGLFFKSLNTPERIDIVEKMGHLERADAEFLLRATNFFRALDHGLRIVTGQAKERLPASRVEEEMLTELTMRWTGDRLPAGSLQAELKSLQSQMRRVFDRIFY